MARTIQEIQNEIFANIAANENLSALNSVSKFAIYRLFVYVVSYSIWVLETLYDSHLAEVQNLLANQKSGGKPWYRTKALAFQYGFDLIPDTDVFLNGDATEEEIEASKIVKYSAVTEATESSRVVIKIAGETDGTLAPLSDAEIEAFEAYIQEIRYAGVKTTIINYLPDQLYLTIRIKRDALVLDANGMNILPGPDGGAFPVNDAIMSFMKELPFNGELMLSALVDKMQLVPGVLDATVIGASSSWIDPDIDGYGTPQPIYISKIAESGYFEVVTFDNISYVV